MIEASVVASRFVDGIRLVPIQLFRGHGPLPWNPFSASLAVSRARSQLVLLLRGLSSELSLIRPLPWNAFRATLAVSRPRSIASCVVSRFLS